MKHLARTALVLLLALAGCQTDGLDWSPSNRVTDFPYTDGHRWVGGIHAPPKGNCLDYALATHIALKRLCGIESRIMLVAPDSQEIALEPPRTYWTFGGDFPSRAPRSIWVNRAPLHAIVVYRAENGRIHLVDNEVAMPVLARGSTDQGWAQQMMPAFVKATIVKHDLLANQ